MTERASSGVEQLQARIEELEAQLAQCQAQQQALMASESRFRAIAEHANDAIATINPAGQVTYLSPNVQRSIGYSAAEVMGQPFAPFIHPDDLPQMNRIVEQVMATEQPYEGLEYRILHQQGHYVWHSANLSAYRDETGQPVLIAIGREATRQKETEAALAKSQAQFEAILQNANVAIFAKDLQGRYIFANPWVTQEIGIPIEQILGKTDAELLPAAVAQIFQENDRLAVESGQAIRTEELVTTPGGDRAYLAIKFPLLNQDGSPYAICGISTNITDLKRTEAALRASEAQLNRILDSTSALIANYRVYADRRFEPDYFSYASLKLWGFPPEAVLTNPQLYQERIDPTDFQVFLDEEYDYIFSERPYSYTYRYHHPDGNLRWIQFDLTSYRDEAEDCWRCTTISMDVSDRKRAEIALQESQAKLNQLLDRTSASIADYRVYRDRRFIPEYFSSGTLQLWGYHPEELINNSQLHLAHFDPEDLQMILDGAYDYIFNERSYRYEYRYYHPDGTVRWIELNLNSYWDETGECWRTPAISIDITDRKRLEEELRQSETKFRRIVENASDLIATATPDGTVTYLSPATLKLLGYTHGELIGQHFDRLIHPDDLAVTADAIAQVMHTGESCTFDHRLIHQNGSIRYVVANLSVYEDENGNPILLGISRDVTERRQLEEELRQSEAKFRRIVENANDTIATITLEGMITYLSPNFLNLIGQKAEDVFGTSFEALVHPDDLPQIYQEMQQGIARGGPYNTEYRLRCADGSYRYFIANSSVYHDENDHPMLLGISRDVTEQRQLEEELRQSEAKFRAIVENANDTIATVNTEGIITYLSPNMLALFGREAAELMGTSFVPLVHPDDVPRCYDSIQQVLTTGEPYQFEYRLRRWDGQYRFFVTNTSLYHDEHGNPMILGVSRDVTEQKQLEEELRQSEAKFRAIVEQANDIIYTINQEGITTYVSPNIEAILGEMPGEYIQDDSKNHFSTRVHPDDLSIVSDVVQRTLVGEKTTVECRALHQDGTWRWLDCNLSPIATSDSSTGIMGIARDISERKRLEEELRQSEYKFRAIVENANDLIYVIDGQGIIVYMSPNAATIHGYSPEEMEGYTFDRFVHPDDLAVGADAIHRAIAGEKFSFELRSFHQNGSLRWFSSNISPFRMADGTMALMGIGRDITERKQAEEALQRSERKYRNIFENSQVGVGRVHLTDTRILDINQRLAEMFGFDDPAELMGQSWQQWMASAAEAERITVMLRDRGALNDEVQIRFRDGSPRWWLSSSRVNLDENCIDFVVVDITDRKHLEEELRQSQHFLNSVIENIPMGFFAKDVRDDFRYVLINRCAEKFVCFSREQGIGHHDYELLPPAQADFYRQQDQLVVQQRSLVETPEVEIVTEQGDRLLSRILKFPLFDDRGSLTHLLCLTDDITELKQREEELRLARDAAEAANRAKSTFLANMSHELRTPLNVILGFTQLMERENALSDRQRNFITTINRSGEHLLNLINDVLEMSKIEAGRITLNPEPFDLRYLLETLQEMFRIRAEAKRLALTFSLPPHLPGTIVADEGKLRQVLINLLGNAVKFTEQGSITLTVDWSAGVQKRDAEAEFSEATGLRSPTLAFSITDTGIGIAPEEVEQLFQPFVQTSSGIQVKEGTGLGLTISRQFVQLMGGDIQLQSTVGQGSTFMFQIPVMLTQTVVTPPPKPQRQVLGLMPGQPIYRLLIVDDRPDNCNLLTHLLQSLGFETQTASNGVEAIARWQSWHPHLIWMDMRMPAMDGYEATRRIRALETAPQTSHSPTVSETPASPIPACKIIALTASAFEEQRTTILAAGCDDFVRKPFREQVIFDKLTEHLGVQFIYAEPSQDETILVQTADAPSATLQVMSPEWIQNLQQAAIEIDADRLLQLVAEIPPQHFNLAEQLRQLVKRFCFDEILELIEGNHDESI